ncbi:MAG: BON domain-containing protein [Chitinophagaceae bacterium]|nr:MAG: BON domain-containing protein [Chitinophagaceae bacterium]
MKILRLLPALVLVAGLSFTGCKPKDADIKANVEKALKDNPAGTGVMVMVNEGVATLSGEVADPAAQASVASTAQGVKNVKSVVNNTTVAPPPAPAAPVTIAADDPLTKGVADATKDFPTVTATVADGVITLNGEIAKAKLQTLMQSLNSLRPKKIENKLTIK